MRLIGILEDIRSLHNVGGMFRIADGLGVEALWLVGSTGQPHPDEPWRRDHLALTKTALGAEQTVAWQYFPRITGAFAAARRAQFSLVGLETAAGALPLDQLADQQLDRIALVVGNEVTGLSPTALAGCDQVARLAMLGQKESFNVAVAFALASYHVLRVGPNK